MSKENVLNISKAFNNQILNNNGRASIRQVVKQLIKDGEPLHSSDGDIYDPCILHYSVESIIKYLIDEQVLEADNLNEEQKRIVNRWLEDDLEHDFDININDELGLNQEYIILGSINWKARKRTLPLCSHIEN